ncbi:hypothetical protein [Rivularia sp. UHCC 0363]|uniref:hypothetical protein n=1 Tax=Rivularia sp. UHCC 0363 TaxID=3110244 RepID=UPI002B203E96|nr:hypothetical protein [Rivularia sp. UHCC 0363]MEA5598843.1 hypothetical protein [Rivularia sp. UHCC 0363]
MRASRSLIALAFLAVVPSAFEKDGFLLAYLAGDLLAAALSPKGTRLRERYRTLY